MNIFLNLKLNNIFCKLVEVILILDFFYMYPKAKNLDQILKMSLVLSNLVAILAPWRKFKHILNLISKINFLIILDVILVLC